MTSNYHTPIPDGAAANAESFNVPLGEMDEALTELLLTEHDGHIIQNEGVDLTQRPRLDFVGAGVDVADDGSGKTIVTISSGIVDGNKSEITVSGSGAIWVINAGAVTLAKIVDATGQYKLMARASSGSGQWEEVTSSANVFSILAAADYAAIRSLLGLVIGTNVQAWDADLDTLAAMTRSGNGTVLGTVTGTLTQNKQLKFDADGNIVASSSDIGMGSGGFFDVAVHARQTSDQTGIVTNTSTVVVFPQEDKDTNSYFDGSTGKFLPTSTTHAGTYEVKLHVTISGLADTKSIWVGVRKNGTTYRWLGLVNTGGTSITGVGNSIKIYLDGVDDYLEAIVWHSHGSNRDTYSGSYEDMCWIDIVRVSNDDLEGW